MPKTNPPFDDDRDAVLSALPAASTNGDAQTPPYDSLVPQGDVVDNFIAALQNNSATAIRLPNAAAIPAAAKAYLQQNALPPTIICSEEWQTLDWHNAGITAHHRAPQDEDHCGLSGIVAAAADYGAMLVESTNRHQLTLSLLPPHHLAIVRTANIHPTLDEILSRSFATTSPPRARNLICGPSRTADIEQTLTLGAHGPTAVHVLIID